LEEKRRSQRVIDNLEAEIISGADSYRGIIMNFSTEGLYMVTATASTVVDLSTTSILRLRCTLPNGKKLDMDCEVKWFQTKTSPHGVSFSMGMEIIDPPKEYRDFVLTYSADN